MATLEPTTAEMKEIWKRAGLWRLGHRFEDDIKVPAIVQTLRCAAMRRHRHNKQTAPEQGVLI